MALKWTDTLAIASALDQAHPDVDPRFINLMDLKGWITVLAGFEDDPARPAEQVLERIQVAWIEERV